jgi:hypothetical protein
LQFIHENWIEWFFPNAVPNLIFAALGWWSLTGAPFALISARGLASTAVIGAAFHAWMVFRGQLFQVLDGTTHRQRMYRYRTGT